MTTTTVSPYTQMPQINQVAVLPNAQQQQPTQPQASGTAAGRRSFRSFVDAMDDFGFDRRDVAGMRQMLSMQEDNQRARAAAGPAVAAAPVANVASFAPGPVEPEIPVVRGLNLTGQGGSELPRLPTFAAGPSAELPRVPGNGSANRPQAASITASELPQLQPSAARTVAVMSFAPPQAQAPATNAQTSSLPPHLQSPLVDKVRDTARTGQRPGPSDEIRARFAANADRRRGPVAAPMPPRLMAQEARWNRDAWPASVNAPRVDMPAAPAASAQTASTQTASSQTAAGDLPRLPTFSSAN